MFEAGACDTEAAGEGCAGGQTASFDVSEGPSGASCGPVPPDRNILTQRPPVRARVLPDLRPLRAYPQNPEKKLKSARFIV